MLRWCVILVELDVSCRMRSLDDEREPEVESANA